MGEGPEMFGAKVEVDAVIIVDGFSAPEMPKDLKQNLDESCKQIFEGHAPLYVGDGSSIPFMEVFSREFPGVNFLMSGVCFPDSNAHSANENIDLKFTAKLISMISVFLSI